MVTLDNPTEIIVGIVSINEGLFDFFKGTMIGGILANILVISSLSSAISAFGFREQRFDKEGVGLQSTLLLFSVVD
jgi:calcium/proton exchanger cax